jgi:hypothetical protein
MSERPRRHFRPAPLTPRSRSSTVLRSALGAHSFVWGARVITSRRSLLCASTAFVATAAFCAGVPAAAEPKGAAGPDQRVIVVLRNQHPSISAQAHTAGKRVAVTRADQAPLIDKARANHASDVRSLHVLNAFSVTAPPAEVARLAADPAVAQVIPDRQVRLASQHPSPTTSVAGPVSSKVCPTDPAKPLLEPEALQLTKTAFRAASTASAQHLSTGAGVRVAFLADGLDVNNPDFVRADGSKVFVDYQDFSGDGPLAPTPAAEAFGDASSIAAQGRHTYDLADYVNPAHPLPAGCTIRIRGMAPDASLVGLKVFPAGGFAFNSAILAALDYAVTVDKVDVVNESFGSNQYPDTTDDPTAMFNEMLIAAGVTVVASTGDAGGENTIGSPASSPGVIAVGATESLRSYAQTTEAGFQLSNGRYRSDNISGLSSSGVTQPGRTLDLVAPGDLGWALCSPNPDIWLECANNAGAPSEVQEFGGSSQSAPLVAGAAALVIQAYRDTHHGASPSPLLIKRLLTGTATDLNLPGSVQGAGLLNSLRAVKAARSIGASTSRASGTGLVTSPTQLDVRSASARTVTRTVKVTNTGGHAVVLKPSLRRENVTRRNEFSPTLVAGGPQFVDSFGINRVYTTQTFTVPRKTSHLTAAIAWPAAGKSVRVVLLDPSGTYSAFSQPQGTGSYGLAEVHDPHPGRWTAIVWSAASAAGYTGTVDLTTTSFRTSKVGRVTPSRVRVPAHSSRTLRVRIPAGDAGDAADALQLAPPGSRIGGIVPVVMRTLIATNSRGGTFAGTFGGGNGRAGIPSPSRSYEFTVPHGAPDLGVSMTVHGNPLQAIYSFLIDPNGEPVSEKTNQTVDADGNTFVSPSLQFNHRDPQAGRWRFVFTVFGPVSGAATSTPYSGEVKYGLADVHATGVPNNPAVDVLAQGRAAQATVAVTNHGAAMDSFFVDARSDQRSTVTLAGRNAAAYVLDPAPLPAFPAFIVPTETDSWTVNGTSDRPISFEVSPFPADHVSDLAFEGDPDRIAGPAGLHPSVTVADPIVAAQTWLALPSQIGPFADTAPKAQASFTATAHTAAFDRAVTSSTGDPVLGAITAPAPSTTPLQLDAGQSGTVTVTINPTAAVGTVVHGVLYVDTIDAVTGSVDEITAVPYAYTVGPAQP